jgi:hypothetical protein
MGGEDTNPPVDTEPRVIFLTESQIDRIADRVEHRFYERVGKKVVEKVLMVIGLGALALTAWLAGKGILK